jgi:hypothetical protein
MENYTLGWHLVAAMGIEPMSETWATQLHNAPLQRRTSCGGPDDAKSFSPTSVQFKGEINDALPRKRHQKRHLEFCIA